MNDGVRMPPSKTVRFAPLKGNADAPVPACVNASVTHHIDGVEWTPSWHLGPVVAQKPEDEGPFSRLERFKNGADLLIQRDNQSGDVRPGVAAAEAHAPRGRDVARRRADEVRMRRLRRVVEEERPLAVGGADDGPGFGREELRRVHAVRRGGPVQR